MTKQNEKSDKATFAGKRKLRNYLLDVGLQLRYTALSWRWPCFSPESSATRSTRPPRYRPHRHDDRPGRSGCRRRAVGAVPSQ